MNEKAIAILDKLNAAADESDYGRYIPKEQLLDILREVMYGTPKETSYIDWKISWGRYYRARFTRVEPLTDKQRATLSKLGYRMLDKGIIKVSKSGAMICPMMTSAEYCEKFGKES